MLCVWAEELRDLVTGALVVKRPSITRCKRSDKFEEFAAKMEAKAVAATTQALRIKKVCQIGIGMTS